MDHPPEPATDRLQDAGSRLLVAGNRAVEPTADIGVRERPTESAGDGCVRDGPGEPFASDLTIAIQEARFEQQCAELLVPRH
jgi:hypothetical protein